MPPKSPAKGGGAEKGSKTLTLQDKILDAAKVSEKSGGVISFEEATELWTMVHTGSLRVGNEE